MIQAELTCQVDLNGYVYKDEVDDDIQELETEPEDGEGYEDEGEMV